VRGKRDDPKVKCKTREIFSADAGQDREESRADSDRKGERGEKLARASDQRRERREKLRKESDKRREPREQLERASEREPAHRGETEGQEERSYIQRMGEQRDGQHREVRTSFDFSVRW
jgi:hypothetical protein